MTWHWPGDRPLSEPMMVSLLMHICITQPQWVNPFFAGNGTFCSNCSECWWRFCLGLNGLTHWGRVTHICVGKPSIIGADNGLSPGRRQAIIWTNARILSIRPLATNFNEILIGIQTFSFKKMYLKMSSAKWRQFCLSLNVLTTVISYYLAMSSCLRDLWRSLEGTLWAYFDIAILSY